MSRPIKNIAASKQRKLLYIARTENQDFNELHRRYLQERFLFRISQSEFKNNFILKGGLLLITIDLPKIRPTMDIDFLVQSVSNSEDNLKKVFKEICSIPIEDGIIFDTSSITTQEIDKDGDYKGIRVKFIAVMGSSRTPMSIDLGFSDKMIPEPREINFPTILDEPSPKLRAYCLETIIAEKFEAITKLSLSNSRMKDFYDLYMILTEQKFNNEVLKKSIKATFEHRKTPLTLSPLAFTSLFYRDVNKQATWQSFLNNHKITNIPADLSVIVKTLKYKLIPIVRDI